MNIMRGPDRFKVALLNSNHQRPSIQKGDIRMAEPKACLEACGHDRRFVVQNPMPNGWKPWAWEWEPNGWLVFLGRSEGPEILQTDPSTKKGPTLHTQTRL